MPYDLLACDLDGTLIDESLALQPALVAAFARAAGRGLGITIATGRMPRSTELYRQALGIRLPVICYNGGLVQDPEGGPDLLRRHLPRGVLAALLDVLAAAPVHPIFFRDEELYCLDRTHAVRQFCEDEGLRANEIPDPRDFLALGAFMKGLLIGHPRDLAVVREELAAVIPSGVRLVHTAPSYLEILPAGSTKGAALEHLAGHLGVPLARVIAVGDHHNDLEMLQVAGASIAMAHAPGEIRAAARFVAPAAADGGLLRALADVVPEAFRP